MRLDRLCLRDFRNYEQQELTLQDGVNLLIGPNAQGKTNVLEAVFLLTGSRSWRAGRKSEMVRFGAQSAFIEAGLYARNRILKSG